MEAVLRIRRRRKGYQWSLAGAVAAEVVGDGGWRELAGRGCAEDGDRWQADDGEIGDCDGGWRRRIDGGGSSGVEK